jgi:hypothetical protein
MGGKTASGGNEVVISMVRNPASPDKSIPRYKLLATTRTSTMQKELQECADAGFESWIKPPSKRPSEAKKWS